MSFVVYFTCCLCLFVSMKKDLHHHAAQKYNPLIRSLNLISLVIFSLAVFANFSGSLWEPLDISVHCFISLNQSPFVYSIAAFISYWSSTELVAIAGIVIAGVFLMHAKWRRALILVVSIAVASELVMLLKAFFMRSRPTMDLLLLGVPDSFPSGHATLAAAFCGACMYVFIPSTKQKTGRRVFAVVCVTVAVLVGLSRIVLNVHWVSDVVAGWSLGVFAICSVILIFQKVYSPTRV